MRCTCMHVRDVFHLFLKFGGPQKFVRRERDPGIPPRSTLVYNPRTTSPLQTISPAQQFETVTGNGNRTRVKVNTTGNHILFYL